MCGSCVAAAAPVGLMAVDMAAYSSPGCSERFQVNKPVDSSGCGRGGGGQRGGHKKECRKGTQGGGTEGGGAREGAHREGGLRVNRPVDSSGCRRAQGVKGVRGVGGQGGEGGAGVQEAEGWDWFVAGAREGLCSGRDHQSYMQAGRKWLCTAGKKRHPNSQVPTLASFFDSQAHNNPATLCVSVHLPACVCRWAAVQSSPHTAQTGV